MLNVFYSFFQSPSRFFYFTIQFFFSSFILNTRFLRCGKFSLSVCSDQMTMITVMIFYSLFFFFFSLFLLPSSCMFLVYNVIKCKCESNQFTLISERFVCDAYSQCFGNCYCGRYERVLEFLLILLYLFARPMKMVKTSITRSIPMKIIKNNVKAKFLVQMKCVLVHSSQICVFIFRSSIVS